MQVNRFGPILAALVAVGLLTGTASAQSSYQAQILLRAGDVAGNVTIPANAGFQVGDLNDTGHVAVVAGTRETGALFQIADGQTTPIAGAGLPAPGGVFPNPLLIGLPVSMNNAGNIVFLTQTGTGTGITRATYFWDRAARALVSIAERGGTGPLGLTWTDGGYFSPVVNNQNDIAFPAGAAASFGRTEYGLFYRTAAGALSVIDLPGFDGSLDAVLPSIDDSGRVAYLTQPISDGTALPTTAYIWERGGRTPFAGVGSTVGANTIAGVTGVWLNNANRDALLLAQYDQAAGGPRALLRYRDGLRTQIVATGSEMPGGGVLRDIPGFGEGVSWANAAGQHAFLALLADGTHAAYLLDASGTVSLILREGMETSAGVVARIAPDLFAQGTTAARSFGIALNTRGQVALPVRLADGTNGVLLLTPGDGTGGPG
jgi:hypothetical protein